MFGPKAGPGTRGAILSFLAVGFAACTSEVENAPPQEASGGGKSAVTAARQTADPVVDPAAKSVAEAAAKSTAPVTPPPIDPLLLLPADAAEKAPDTFRARFTTTKGDIVIEVTRDWAPRGADRFYSLVKHGFFSDMAFFRVVNGFVAQFGMHFDERVRTAWRYQTIPDDPVKQSNKRGTVTFASSGQDSRTTQLFLNFSDDNKRLDGMGFSPFGRVVEGMGVVDQLDGRYGDAPPHGRGPQQPQIDEQGNDYLRAHFPKLDYIVSATIEE